MIPAAALQIVLVLLITGVLVWAIGAMPAIDATFKQFAKIIIIVIAAILVIPKIIGLFGGSGDFHIFR